MGPLRGDGNSCVSVYICCRLCVEKMGPLRGDGNFIINYSKNNSAVEKMGPLRGDGNLSC